MKRNIVYILSLVFFFSISCNKKLSNEELYKQGLAKNIEVCVDVLVQTGYDSIKAEVICSCALEKAYLADPSFVKMGTNDFAKFMAKEKIYEICDSTYNVINSDLKE